MAQMRYFLLAGVFIALAAHPLAAQVSMVPGSNMLRTDYSAAPQSDASTGTSPATQPGTNQNNNTQQTPPLTDLQKQDADWEDVKKREAAIMQDNTDMAEFRARYTMREESDMRFVEVTQHGPPSLKPTDAFNDRMLSNGIRLWGIDILPSITAGETYNDNIYLRNGKPNFARTADEITTIQPSIQIRRGDPAVDTLYVAANYSPSFVEFVDHPGEDTTNEYFDGEFGWRTPKLSLYGKQTVESILGGEVESGDLINEFVTTTDASLQYELTPKTSIELTERLINRNYDQGINSVDEEVGTWVNYQLTPKLTLSVGPDVGWVYVSQGAFQQYAQANVRAIYETGPKLKFFAQGGVEAREYQGTSGDDLNAVFRAGGEWQMSEKTVFRLEANRYLQPSNTYVNEDVTATGCSAMVLSRMNEFFMPSLQMGYQNAVYSVTNHSSSSLGASNREDNYFFMAPSLLFNVKPWWDITLSYSYRENLSTLSQGYFYNNLFNLSSTVRF